MNEPHITKEELLKKLTPEQVNVCHLAGTEPPFSGKWNKNYETGMYTCAVCDAPLFSSETKFDSGTGWPAFDDVVKSDAVELKPDYSFGMTRTAISCKNCGSHLGHLFDDAPTKTGKYYCVNSVSLDFKKKE